MKAYIKFMGCDNVSTIADIEIQDNLIIDLCMPLTKGNLDKCAQLKLTVSILYDTDELFSSDGTIHVINTQVTPEAIAEIDYNF